MVIEIILKSLWFALPAYLANMTPVIVAKPKLFEFLNKPIDFDKTWRQKPILGKGKTWRGLVLGTLVAIAVAAGQSLLYRYETIQDISIINYNETSFILFGLLAGLGALIGDLIKSFFKRRIGIASGRPWPIADQLDFAIGFMLFTYYLIRPELIIVISVMIITLIAHPLTNIIGYLLKIKKVWW